MIEKIYPTYTIKIGRNAKENWNLLAESDPEDYWFHLENQSSPFVILKTDNISKEMIINACNLCKDYSKMKNMKKVAVIYTQTKNVSFAKTVGSVIPQKTTRFTIYNS